MNREGAETFLRLLTEAALRDELAAEPSPGAGGLGVGRARVSVAGQALTAVRAIDQETVAEILADFDVAVSVRQLHGPSRAQAGPQAAQPTWSMPIPSPARSGTPAGGTPAGGTPAPDHEPAPGAADRLAPIGLTVPFHAGGVGGELYLMSFAKTGSGARLIALWGQPALSRGAGLGLQLAELFPVGLLTVTDDRGAAYELDIAHAGGSEWIGRINLDPAPPDGVRWLEVAAPPGPPTRVSLLPASGRPGSTPADSTPTGSAPTGSAPTVRAADRSAGEQLLILLAAQLLFEAAQFPLVRRPERRFSAPRPGQAIGTGLGFGDVIAALEAADLLTPLSPLPAQLAALCASLRIDGHGIAAEPADHLPEAWLSLLTYYQRRKPDTAQVRDGFAAVTAALPELDGIGLALVGLYNNAGTTVLHVLARGLRREDQRGPHGINLDFPLSLWLRDSGGRWHATRPIGSLPAAPEHSIGLTLVPPLPRSTTWVEVLVSGRSGEVRARLPLHWGSPP